jgi:hypothetical protein
LAAFRARIQAAFKFGIAMFYCSAQHTNHAHQSSWLRDGRSSRFGSRSRSRRLSTAGRSYGSPLSLVLFTVRHDIALVERTSALVWNNIADFGLLRLVRLLHDFGSLGRGETVAFAERFPCYVLLEFLVREVLIAIKGLAVDVINSPLGVGVTSNVLVVRRKGDKSLHVGHQLL